jgi:NAD(P)H dehydrogenase (quinone)
MNHLIIFCHPNPASFNGSIADAVEAVSAAMGHDTCRRDLYGIGFNPVLGKVEIEAPAHMRAQDVRQEQEFITQADLLTFVYPVWWTGMPAMLKGYIDRVFSQDFAYILHGDMMTGLLTGKKALLFSTTGMPSTLCTSRGMHEAMARTTDTGIFELCGIEVLNHAFFGSIATSTEEERKSYLSEVVAIVSRYL